MEFWTSDQVKSTLAAVYKNAATDEAFRKLCLRDPREAVRQITGRELPDEFKLRFVDNAGADLTIVLPDPIRADTLADNELESVSGGKSSPGTGMCSKMCTNKSFSIFC